MQIAPYVCHNDQQKQAPHGRHILTLIDDRYTDRHRRKILTEPIDTQWKGRPKCLSKRSTARKLNQTCLSSSRYSVLYVSRKRVERFESPFVRVSTEQVPVNTT
jgi:hypothetical protein